MSARGVYTAAQRTAQKEIVQYDFYKQAARCVAARPRVLMLPGRAPAAEVSIIERAVPGAHITAVDKDPIAARAAMSWVHRVRLEPDLALASDLGRFDIINLDLCAHIPGCNRAHRANMPNVITVAAKATQGVLGVFCSYARDEVLPGVSARLLRYGSRIQDRGLEELPEALIWRSKMIYSMVWEAGLAPLRVYRYTSRAFHMLGVVFGMPNLQRWKPFFQDVPK